METHITEYKPDPDIAYDALVDTWCGSSAYTDYVIDAVSARQMTYGEGASRITCARCLGDYRKMKS